MSTYRWRNDASGPPLLLLIDGATAPLAVLGRRQSVRDRLLVRLRARTLDQQLAAGRSPDDERLRALRADVLVSPRTRRDLAGYWESLISAARGTGRGFGPRPPLPAKRILSAENDIRRLANALRSPLPVPARGVAMAGLLLTDGAGPVYNPHNRRSLDDAVRDAIRYLDPTTSLLRH